MHALDLTPLLFLNGLSGRSEMLDQLIVFLANDLIYGVAGFIVYAAYREWRAGRAQAACNYVVALVAGFIARLGVAPLVHLFIKRPRPYDAFPLPHLFTVQQYSFPSEHTIFLFAVATAVCMVDRRAGFALYAVSLLIGAARVAAGVHYPSDILGGMLLGMATGYVIVRAWQAWRKSRNARLRARTDEVH